MSDCSETSQSIVTRNGHGARANLSGRMRQSAFLLFFSSLFLFFFFIFPEYRARARARMRIRETERRPAVFSPLRIDRPFRSAREHIRATILSAIIIGSADRIDWTYRGVTNGKERDVSNAQKATAFLVNRYRLVTICIADPPVTVRAQTVLSRTIISVLTCLLSTTYIY